MRTLVALCAALIARVRCDRLCVARALSSPQGNGVYFSFTTLLTIGLGDKAPRTPAGKLSTCVYILGSLTWIFCLLSDIDR